MHKKTIRYVFREMTDVEGGFYCAQDADSDGVEGRYYVFEPQEILDVLGETDGAAFNKYFDITASGNFEGKSIPNLLHEPPASDMEAHISRVYEYRKTRAALHKDDKILTSWNGLMIAALSKAYGVFNEPLYLQAAEKAVGFIENNLANGAQVFVSYRGGKRSEHGFLDDYAFYIWGLVELYGVTLNPRYLIRARVLTQQCLEDFSDGENGGFFLCAKDSGQLFARPKETYDGATPSGNSVMAYNLLMLSRILKDKELLQRAESQIEYMSGQSAGYNSFFMLTLLSYMYTAKEIVCVLKNPAELESVAEKLDKNAVITILENETAEYRLKDGKTTYYICENNRCLPPVNELSSQ